MKVKQINIKKNMTVKELITEFEYSGVLGAGRVGRATEILSKMISDEDTKVFLSIGGPFVPGGLRNIITKMIKNKQIDVLITSGANITHDLLESFGGSHYRGYGFNDDHLNHEGIGRIGDVYTKNVDFEVFERKIANIFNEIAISINYKPNIISINDLLREIGKRINDENSILKAAYENDVSIFSPGLVDSMLGLQLWMFTQDHDLTVDAVKDMHVLSDLVFEAKCVGAVILGGGLPKHYTLASNLLKGGIDSAIQITMDRSETGSLSGAPLEEAKSWSKAKVESDLVTVIGDVTILFPLILSGAIDKMKN
ncbi:MAG: deoxyhypusine synthase [Methanobrevibacter sp.]|jgi:deoxyhypusine synthase|nr:deoxyhypusine synthase [Candidatus Methanovirga basalitermitum]